MNTCIIRILERENKENREEAMVEEIKITHFSELMDKFSKESITI